METKTKIIFRADGNANIGLGHIYRLIAVSEKILGNFTKIFIHKKSSPEIQKLLESYFDSVQLLSEEASPEEEKREWINLLSGNEIIILDGYSFDDEYQIKLKQKGAYLIYLDDINAFKQYADLVINVGTDKAGILYTHKAFYTEVRGGLAHSFLRKSFYTLAKNTFSGIKVSKKGILICLGGADPTNKTLETYTFVRNAFPAESIHIVVGPAYKHLNTLKEILHSDPGSRLYHNIGEIELANLMNRTEIAVCSASTVSYEYLTTGGLLFIYKTAENQSHLYNYLLSKKWAFPAELITQKQNLKQDIDSLNVALKQFYENSFNEYIRQVANLNSYTLRKANIHDAEILFQWIKEMATLNPSLNTEPILWENHIRWFQQKLNSDRDVILTMEKKGKPAGQIRFEKKEEHTLISFILDKNEWGKGLGYHLLKTGTQHYLFNYENNQPLIGYVKADNAPSLKLFRKCNFEETLTQVEGIPTVKFTLKHI